MFQIILRNIMLAEIVAKQNEEAKAAKEAKEAEEKEKGGLLPSRRARKIERRVKQHAQTTRARANKTAAMEDEGEAEEQKKPRGKRLSRCLPSPTVVRVVSRSFCCFAHECSMHRRKIRQFKRKLASVKNNRKKGGVCGGVKGKGRMTKKKLKNVRTCAQTGLLSSFSPC
jgi:hypothetical protein